MLFVTRYCLGDYGFSNQSNSKLKILPINRLNIVLYDIE